MPSSLQRGTHAGVTKGTLWRRVAIAHGPAATAVEPNFAKVAQPLLPPSAIHRMVTPTQSDTALAGNNHAIGVILTSRVAHVLSINRLNIFTGPLALDARCVGLLTCLERRITPIAVGTDALTPIHGDTVDSVEDEDAGRLAAAHECDVLGRALGQTAAMRFLTAASVLVSPIAVGAFATAPNEPATSRTEKVHPEKTIAVAESPRVLRLAGSRFTAAPSSSTEATRPAGHVAAGSAATTHARRAGAGRSDRRVPGATRAARAR